MSTIISASIDDCSCFSTMIPIDCKITIFSLYSFVYFFGNNYSIGEFISTTSKERMTKNIIFAGATPIN